MKRAKHEDPRYQRSLEALIGAITQLADRKPITSISINSVAEAAGVSRPTFYRHAKDVDDLVRCAALLRLGNAFAPGPRFDDEPVLSFSTIQNRIAEHVTPALNHLADHRFFYTNVLKNSGSPDLYAGIVDLLTNRVDPALFRSLGSARKITTGALTNVITGGLMWHIVNWLRDKEGAPDAQTFAHEIGTIAATLFCQSVLDTPNITNEDLILPPQNPSVD